MYKRPKPLPDLHHTRAGASMLDKNAFLSILACAFALIVSPILADLLGSSEGSTDYAARLFWPAMAAISIIFAVQAGSPRLIWPPHILCLFACLVLAGASVMWAFKPESSLIRFLQQVMVVTTVVVPALLADRRADLMRALFLCFAFACVLNVFFVLGGSPMTAQYWGKTVVIGYPGYFGGKNYLGECAALALLLSFHEILFTGLRRTLAIITIAIATFLLFASDSKTALGLALLCPLLAGATLYAVNKTRISPALILLSIPLCYYVLSSVSGFSTYRLAYEVYGDSTLTGRTIIWDFASYEIGRRPLLGFGYQSFWLVGPDAPSVVDAPGWVKDMPNAHNGYYDTTLELGYVGYYLLIIFILTTLHAIGRIAHHDTARAWLVLSAALYIICFNYLESLWMRGFEFLWVVFLLLAAEAGRYWRPVPAVAKTLQRVDRRSRATSLSRVR